MIWIDPLSVLKDHSPSVWIDFIVMVLPFMVHLVGVYLGFFAGLLLRLEVVIGSSHWNGNGLKQASLGQPQSSHVNCSQSNDVSPPIHTHNTVILTT